MPGDDLTISDLERETGLTRRTIRWYISEGLVGRPDTRGRGARYTQAQLDRLRAIQHLRDLEGLTISEIRRRLQEAAADELQEWAASPPSVAPPAALGFAAGRSGRPQASVVSDEESERQSLERLGASLAAHLPREMRGSHASSFAAPSSLPRHVPEAAKSQPPTAPLERLAYELHQLLGNRRVPRQVRSESWHQLQITPDILLSVRGERDAEQVRRLERVADYLKEILLGGLDSSSDQAPERRAAPGPDVVQSWSYPFRLVDGHPVVTVEGKRLLLDTGTPVSVGAAFTWAGRPFSPARSILGYDLAVINPLLVEPVDALVGADAIGDVWLSISADRGEARVSRTPFTMPGVEVALSAIGGVPAARARVRGQEVTALIDTAARLCYVDGRLVEGLEPEGEEVEDFFPGLGIYRTTVFDLDVMVGGETIPVAVGILPPELREAFALTGAQMVLGLGPILARYDVGIALPEGRMVLQRTGSAESPRTDEPGASRWLPWRRRGVSGTSSIQSRI